MRPNRLLRPTPLALILFVGIVLFLFRLSLFQGWTFVGDSDRLNSVINTRLFEVDALRAGRPIPMWSDQQFMGYSVIGLHWMLARFSPVPYLLALVSPDQMLYLLGVVTATMLALTIAAAYWMLGAYTNNPLARVIGALLFGLGSFTIHKIVQLDVSSLPIVLMPVLMILVRTTRRETAVRAFLAMAALWAMMVGFTILQEIAYVAMLFGAYALYRSARLWSIWPVLVAGLAFGCGVLVASPRVITVATDIPDVARTSVNFQTAPVETLRYWGDGLMGRTAAENEAVRGATLNMHEGVQLLTSALGAWAVLAAGLTARSGWSRAWGIVLTLVLSIALAQWWRPFYDAPGRLPVVSRELQVVLMNAVVIGLPLWLATWWISRRRADQSRSDETVAAAEDTPFFLAFAALGMAAIVLPEARVFIYYGFMKMDFQHARISMVMTLPLAALVTIVLSRFLPNRLGMASWRWIGVGALAGLAIWLGREVLADVAVAQLDEVVEALRPRRLLTEETVRVASSLVILAAASLTLFARSGSASRAMAGGALVSMIFLEAESAANFRIAGPHTREQAIPFQGLNYLNVPPGGMRVPTAEERDALHRRLEADAYRVVLRQDPRQFPALIESHLAAFWNLRLVEGYSTGLPRRLEALPWPEGVTTAHHLDVNEKQGPPWKLLAALNVKYVVTVSQSLWYNPAPGAAVPPLDVQRLQVQENPYPVAPRAFFVQQLSPAGPNALFPGDDGERPITGDQTLEDVTWHSVVEGLPGLTGDRAFGVTGRLDVSYEGDLIRAHVDPAAEDRFLVLNERFYPGWQATLDGQPTTIYPTNVVMRGVLVPAGATIVELRYVPFLAAGYGIALLAVGFLVTALAAWGLLRATALRTLPADSARQPAAGVRPERQPSPAP